MGFYHIKNIKIDRKNNNISADLADSNIYPLTYHHIDCLCDKGNFKEKYAHFIYNVITGNFHPNNDNKYSKLVMNNCLDNYYDDAHDIGELATYEKYKPVINAILNNRYDKNIVVPSDREINPEDYYILTETQVDSKYDYSYLKNKKGELYCLKNNELYLCDHSNKNFGYPLYKPLDIDRFYDYNYFLKKDKELEL